MVSKTMFANGSYLPPSVQGDIYALNEARMALADLSGRKIQAGANLEPESPEFAALQTELFQIYQIDKSLEVRKTSLDTQETYLRAMEDQLKQRQKKEFERQQKSIQNGFIFG